MGQRGLPLRPLRRLRAAFEIGECGRIGRDQPGPRAALDRHVAHRHAAFHAERRDRLAAILDHMAGAARRAGRADDRQGDVLGGDAGADRAAHLDPHVARLLLDQGLGGKDMFDLAGADAVGQRAKGAMGRGMAVAADDGGAGQRPALFGADDVDDPLADVVDIVKLDAEFAGVLAQRLDLDAAFGVADRDMAVLVGGQVVVGHRDRLSGGAHRTAGQTQAFEGLRAGHLMHEMPVDIQNAGAVGVLMHHMGVPDLVVKRPWRNHTRAPAAKLAPVIGRDRRWRNHRPPGLPIGLGPATIAWENVGDG
jgi:hypothetical protein